MFTEYYYITNLIKITALTADHFTENRHTRPYFAQDTKTDIFVKN